MCTVSHIARDLTSICENIAVGGRSSRTLYFLVRKVLAPCHRGSRFRAGVQFSQKPQSSYMLLLPILSSFASD